MAQARIGRPPNPLDPEASCAARLGYELRTAREDKGLTLEKLAALVGFTPQHISEVERAKAKASHPFLTGCEEALEAAGKLLSLLPAVQRERDEARQARADARRKARQAEAATALRCEADSDAGEDLEPTNRRGLIGAGAAAAIGLSTTAAPAAARDVDPELPARSALLLDQLGRLDAAFGPQDLLDTVRYEVGRLAAHAKMARGGLRTNLLRTESWWAEFASWLCNDTGRWRERDAWTDRALRLAKAIGDADAIALARMRQGQWAIQELDAQRAVALAEDALQTPGVSAGIRARCALRAAHGHALANDTTSCERRLDEAAQAPADTHARTSGAVTPVDIGANTARCWLYMKPVQAVTLYEDALSAWPRDQVAQLGLHQARFALACAKAGELDRAKAEGRKAFAMQQANKSVTAQRELHRLTAVLRAA